MRLTICLKIYGKLICPLLGLDGALLRLCHTLLGVRDALLRICSSALLGVCGALLHLAASFLYLPTDFNTDLARLQHIFLIVLVRLTDTAAICIGLSAISRGTVEYILERPDVLDIAPPKFEI
jgi:hypothetical protein